VSVRLINAERIMIVRLYRQGKSIRVTAGLVGRSYGTVRSVLLAEGVPLRRPGGYHPAGAR
jgi:hypothetical protein